VTLVESVSNGVVRLCKPWVAALRWLRFWLLKLELATKDGLTLVDASGLAIVGEHGIALLIE
jgi:hypothetical protein